MIATERVGAALGEHTLGSFGGSLVSITILISMIGVAANIGFFETGVLNEQCTGGGKHRIVGPADGTTKTAEPHQFASFYRSIVHDGPQRASSREQEMSKTFVLNFTQALWPNLSRAHAADRYRRAPHSAA